jgi:hypothetical protein
MSLGWNIRVVLVLLLLCWCRRRWMMVVSVIECLAIWLRGWAVIVTDIWLMCHRRIGILSRIRIVHWRSERCHIRFLGSVLVWSSSRLQLLLRCTRGYCDWSRFERISSRVRSLHESWNRWRRRLNGVQETALWVVALLGWIFGILRPCFCRRLAQVVPELVLLAKVNLGCSSGHPGRGIPLCPLLL